MKDYDTLEDVGEPGELDAKFLFPEGVSEEKPVKDEETGAYYIDSNKLTGKAANAGLDITIVNNSGNQVTVNQSGSISYDTGSVRTSQGQIANNEIASVSRNIQTQPASISQGSTSVSTTPAAVNTNSSAITTAASASQRRAYDEQVIHGYNTVIDSPAYDEQVIDHYQCSCGAVQ